MKTGQQIILKSQMNSLMSKQHPKPIQIPWSSKYINTIVSSVVVLVRKKRVICFMLCIFIV